MTSNFWGFGVRHISYLLVGDARPNSGEDDGVEAATMVVGFS